MTTTKNTFVFDPDFDYYELFELCMYDGTTDVLDDPEDYDEFVRALREGRYDPETETLAPTPWTEEDQKALVKHIDQVCAVNNSWFASHMVGALSLWAFGDYVGTIRHQLEEFPQYLMKEDIGRLVSPEQYMLAATEYCQGLADKWDQEEDKLYTFENIWGQASYLHQLGSSPQELAASVIKRKPEWAAAVAEFLLDGELGCDETWELVLMSPVLREALKPQLLAKLPEIERVWNGGADEPYDWLCFGEEVAEFVTATGIEAQSKETSHAWFIAEECRKSKERGAQQKAEAEAKAEAEFKAKMADPEYQFPAAEFQEALDDCYFDDVFADAERFKSLILENIEEIASNFNEENTYEATGSEPQWLLDALLNAGVEFG